MGLHHKQFANSDYTTVRDEVTMKAKVCAIGLLLAAAMVAGGQPLTLTFKETGKTVQGEVVSLDKESVVLKLTDGTTVSARLDYLIESDRAKVAKAFAEQWKEVEVYSMEGTVSFYKKCVVSWGRGTEVFIKLLPSAVEAILIKKKDLADQISAMRKSEGTYSEKWEGIDGSSGSHVHNISPVQKSLIITLNHYNADTRMQRTVDIRNTGLVYQGIPVYECRSKPPESIRAKVDSRGKKLHSH
jgi:hypothetical protein